VHALAQAPRSYDRRTVALHWLSALLIAGLWLTGQTIDWFPRGLHISFGVVMGLHAAARLSGRARAAAQAGGHSAPAAAAFTAFRLPSLLAKTALARNSPSDPLRGRRPSRGVRLSSVLKHGALDASLGAMRMPFWLRGSAPPMGPRARRPGPLGSRWWGEGVFLLRCG